MPNVLDHVTRRAMTLRGYQSHSIPTDAGAMAALSWRGAGTLAPLAVVHGWASAGVHHVLSARRLKRQVRQIVLPDLPGHGFSDAPEALTPQHAAVGLQQTLDALLIEPTVLLGSSLGGLAAVRYALARPENVRALILVSPFGAPTSPEQLQGLTDLIRVESLGDTKRFLDRLSRRPLKRNWLFAPEMRRILRRRSLRELLDHAPSTPLLTAGEVRSIPVPITVVWGEHEALLPDTHLGFWESVGAEIIRPAASGHSPALDEPRWFTELVLERVRAVS